MESGRRKPMPPEPGIVHGKGENTNAGNGSLLQFKITLKGIRPPVWRRFLVPEGISLSDLHDVIQEVWDGGVVICTSFCARENSMAFRIPSGIWKESLMREQ